MDHDEADPELLRRISDFASLSMRDPVQSPQILKAVEERVRLFPLARLSCTLFANNLHVFE